MPKLTISNPGDPEAMETLRGAPRETASERNEHILRVYGSIALVVCILIALGVLGFTIYHRLHSVTSAYQQSVAPPADQSMSIPAGRPLCNA